MSRLWASGVKMPVLMVEVLEDAWTRNPKDAQKTFDLLGSVDKELLWIEDTTRRFKDGYNYFGRHPEKSSPSSRSTCSDRCAAHMTNRH